MIITGTVQNRQGEPLYMAHVYFGTPPVGTVTNIEGKFTLNVPDGAPVTVSYVGLQPLTFIPHATEQGTIILENAGDLPEFEVTAVDRRPLAAVILYTLGRIFGG